MNEYKKFDRQAKLSKPSTCVLNLDSFWEEVSCLSYVFWNGESSSNLSYNVSSRVACLQPKSESSEHSKTAVLDFLKFDFSVFLFVEVQFKWVPGSELSNSEVSRHAGSSLFLDEGNTLQFDPGSCSYDLSEGKTWYVFEGFNWVRVVVRVYSGPLVTWEGSVKSRPDESYNSELSDTSVGELSLAEPVKVAHGVPVVLSVEEGGDVSGGESNWVESDISWEGPVEGGWGSVLCEWERLGWAVVFSVQAGYWL